MSRVADILYSARFPLGDLTKERWSDETLLRALDEGQKDIAKQVEMFKDIIVVPLRTAEHTYNLPTDTISVLRVTLNGRKLDMKTTAYMDEQGLTGTIVSTLPAGAYNCSSLARDSYWMTATVNSEPFFVIYDKLKRHKLRVWPTPIGQDLINTHAEIDQPYGVLASVSGGPVLDTFGVTTDVIDTNEIITTYDPNNLGELSSLFQQDSLVIYRSKLSPTILSINDELLLDPVWDVALKHYVVGMTFRNDINAENRAAGNDQLLFYNRELERIQTVASKSSVSADSFQSSYNAMG